MKYAGIVIAILLVSISVISVAQDTYTREEYISMLPTLDKVDLARMPIMPHGGNVYNLSHRTWYYDATHSAQAMLQKFGVTISLAEQQNITTCIYAWNIGGDLENIIVMWNRTTNQVYGVVWLDWNEGFIYDNYPRVIADYSIYDLPLITYQPKYSWSVILLGLTFAIVAVVGLYYIKYGRHRH